MRRSVSLIIAALVVIALLLHLSIEATFFLGLLAASAFGVITYRLSIVAGLVCVACCPILLLIDRSTWVQQSPLVNYYVLRLVSGGAYDPKDAINTMATWAYYFFCIGVLALIVGRVRPSYGNGEKVIQQ